MGAAEITLTAFVAIASLAFAVGLVVREVLIAARGTAAASPGRSLRRPLDPFDIPNAGSLSGRIDRAFDRLVLETGWSLSPSAAFLAMVTTGLLLGGVMWLYHDQPLAGIAGAMCGLGLPLLALSVVRSRRLRAVRDELPHVIEMLARATRAGRSVEQALALVAHESGGLLGQEFRRCEQQLALGGRFDKAMKSLAGRVRLMEMQILATTLIVQRQSGGPLSETLDRMSAVIRDRLNAQRQVRASTAAGRMSTVVVASIAPLAVVFLFSFQRDHLNTLFAEPLGRSMLLVALVLESIGLTWVLWLMRTER